MGQVHAATAEVTPDSPAADAGASLAEAPAADAGASLAEAPVGERIRRLRLERGLSQAELGADRLTKGFISQVESGRSRPSPESLQYIAGRLEVPLMALLPGMELAQERAFLLRAAAAAIQARQADQAEALLDEVKTLVDAPSDLARFHRLLGELLLLRDEVEGALGEAVEAYGLGSSADDHEEEALAANLVARLHFAAGRYPAALMYVDLAADLARRPSVPAVLRARILTNRGQVLFVIGDAQRALDAFQSGIEAAEDAEDLEQLGRASLGLGEAARRVGDLPSAIAHAERALSLFERLEMRQMQARLLANLGEVFLDQGDLPRARTYEERAAQAGAATGDTQTEGYALERLAVIAIRDGRPSDALELAHRAVDCSMAIPDSALEALALTAIAESHAALGDRAATDVAFDRAELAASQATRTQHIALVQVPKQTLLRRGAVLRDRGDLQAAAECFERAARLPG